MFLFPGGLGPFHLENALMVPGFQYSFGDWATGFAFWCCCRCCCYRWSVDSSAGRIWPGGLVSGRSSKAAACPQRPLPFAGPFWSVCARLPGILPCSCKHWERRPRVSSHPSMLTVLLHPRCQTGSCRQRGHPHLAAMGRCTRWLVSAFCLYILVEAGSALWRRYYQST